MFNYVVVVVHHPRHMEGNGATSVFRSLQNCQFHHRRLESLEHCMCLCSTLSNKLRCCYIHIKRRLLSLGPGCITCSYLKVLKIYTIHVSEVYIDCFWSIFFVSYENGE